MALKFGLLPWVIIVPAFAYQCLAIFAGLRRVIRKPNRNQYSPPVSVLKPIRGLDPNTAEAFVSQARQNYPEFEILFGVRDPDDPAIPVIKQLESQFSNVRLIHCTTDAPNGKVGTLVELSGHAQHPIWVVNDSDIKVTPAYLAEVVAPLQDPAVGVVTCPYRAFAHSAATTWEAFGIATDFIPSTLVAETIGVREFGLGSTLAFRAADLRLAGGFEALSDYLADDYQLAKRICDLGKRSVLSSYVVETSLGDATWLGVWRHQLRWARTIKASKGPGYAGLPITHAGVWALIALSLGFWPAAAVLVFARIFSAFTTGWGFLGSRIALRLLLIAPAWDCYAFAVWLTSYFGNTVNWRNRVLTVLPDGRIA